MDKSAVTKVCVDDFAFRKRYTYGTVMVDLETHRIIDIIDSRETKQVEDWLKSYPNLVVISRDGAQTYSSASTNSHPDALQISDRFHLLKNLSDAVQKYMYRLFPSRLVISATSQNAEMQALYDTRNRTERIHFAHKKRQEGYMTADIALLLHSSSSTIRKYLAIPKDKIPEAKENARERQHIRQMQNKQQAIEEVRTLYAQGNAIDKITYLTGHTTLTVKNYLKKDCPLSNGHYDCRRPGKLAPYEQTVIEMRSNGITYEKIHEHICKNGYTGTVASLRMFMQKERTHLKNVSKNENEPVEYIPRKFFCQLIYRELERVKGLTLKQYEAAIKRYPVLGKIYWLLREFHRIIFSRQSKELDSWITKAKQLEIDEVDTYINGLKHDITAVKNGIDFEYNNGLAEGSVNKIKLIKRIMYGRNSFLLLKAKLLLNEYYYQIN
ncbi:transposase [Lacrimispora sp. BS-2]|uniref:Transposase n=1 Tax=Lacrimispora sp. BS-2 TaxID=3151850 RepID=A0AAU7PNE5_9FIRM